MKRVFLLFFAQVLWVTQNSIAQDIEALFAQEGLSINAFHYNFFDGTFPTSYTYHQVDSVCEKEVLSFIHNFSGTTLHLYFEERKVYRYSEWNCQKILLYDFSLEVGQSIQEGYYSGYRLIDTSSVTLLNGEIRTKYYLTSDRYLPVTWVEGIGDVTNGLIPNFGDFEGYDEFVCAKKGTELLWLNETEAGLCDSLSCARPVSSFTPELNQFQLSVKSNSFFASSFNGILVMGIHQPKKNLNIRTRNRGAIPYPFRFPINVLRAINNL